MTNLIVQIEQAKTTKELHRIMYENIKWFNSFAVLDYIARIVKRRIKKCEFKSFELN